MKVYKAINAIQTALSKTGILKDRKNAQQGYNFRGIDDVYNALSPLLSAHGLVILPRVLTRTATTVLSKAGGTLNFVVVEAEFDFVAVEDGSKHTVKMFGEAMDSADKATNKAMSAAYKYACLEAFAIPTESDNDADAHTHEIAAQKPAITNTLDEAKKVFEPRREVPKVTPARAASDGTVTFVPALVTKKEGESARGKWIKFGVKSPDGIFYGTFFEGFGLMAEQAKANGTEVTIGFKEDGKFFNIETMTAKSAAETQADIEAVPF